MMRPSRPQAAGSLTNGAESEPSGAAIGGVDGCTHGVAAGIRMPATARDPSHLSETGALGTSW